MTIADEYASAAGKAEVVAIRALHEAGSHPDGNMAKRLKELGIYNPKSARHPITLYGHQVIRILKEKGKWKD